MYYGPTDSNIAIDQIRELEPIPNSWIYLRVSFPDDDLFGKMRSLYPENAMVYDSINKFCSPYFIPFYYQ